MPDETSHGLPYPLGTDPISDGDNVIRELAETVDGYMYSVPRTQRVIKSTQGNSAYFTAPTQQIISPENPVVQVPSWATYVTAHISVTGFVHQHPLTPGTDRQIQFQAVLGNVGAGPRLYGKVAIYRCDMDMLDLPDKMHVLWSDVGCGLDSQIWEPLRGKAQQICLEGRTIGDDIQYSFSGSTTTTWDLQFKETKDD